MTDKINLKNFLSQLDDEQKDSFKSMPREEQLLSILSIELSNSNRLAKVERKQIDMEADVKTYRREREKREDNGNEEVMNTTQKILKAIADADAKKFNYAVWFRDRVLPSVITVITLALLALAFGYKP